MINLTSKNKALLLANSALDKKAKDIVVLDMKKLLYFIDYFVICSADNERQIKAIVNNIDKDMAELGYEMFHKEGVEQSGWVLVDYGEIIAHIFFPHTRKFYDLESLWADAPIKNVKM